MKNLINYIVEKLKINKDTGKVDIDDTLEGILEFLRKYKDIDKAELVLLPSESDDKYVVYRINAYINKKETLKSVFAFREGINKHIQFLWTKFIDKVGGKELRGFHVSDYESDGDQFYIKMSFTYKK